MRETEDLVARVEYQTAGTGVHLTGGACELERLEDVLRTEVVDALQGPQPLTDLQSREVQRELGRVDKGGDALMSLPLGKWDTRASECF